MQRGASLAPCDCPRRFLALPHCPNRDEPLADHARARRRPPSPAPNHPKSVREHKRTAAKKARRQPLARWFCITRGWRPRLQRLRTPRSTSIRHPTGARGRLGPRCQVRPARARGETGCRIPCRVASGCWEGVKAPPYLQTRPDHAPRPFPGPHQHPWRRVSGARGRANLCASSLHPARRACLTRNIAARLPIRSCSLRRRPAPAHPTELRPNARARAAAHAKDTSCDGSRSCASAELRRASSPRSGSRACRTA